MTAAHVRIVQLPLLRFLGALQVLLACGMLAAAAIGERPLVLGALGTAFVLFGSRLLISEIVVSKESVVVRNAIRTHKFRIAEVSGFVFRPSLTSAVVLTLKSGAEVRSWAADAPLAIGNRSHAELERIAAYLNEAIHDR